MKRHQQEMSNMREGMEANHKKRLREAVELASTKILNNGSGCGTNNDVPNLSMPKPVRKLFNDKKTRMTGIEVKDKDREEDKARRAMREEVEKSVRDEFCSTLQHRPEAMRKDHKQLTREELESTRDRYEDNILALR